MADKLRVQEEEGEVIIEQSRRQVFSAANFSAARVTEISMPKHTTKAAESIAKRKRLKVSLARFLRLAIECNTSRGGIMQTALDFRRLRLAI
jgi:hypothetical protein